MVLNWKIVLNKEQMEGGRMSYDIFNTKIKKQNAKICPYSIYRIYIYIFKSFVYVF